MQLFFISIQEKPKTTKEIIKSKFIVFKPPDVRSHRDVPVRPNPLCPIIGCPLKDSISKLI